MLNKIIRMLFALILITISFALHADNNILKELEAGKSVVLIINADEKSKSEQYADWSHYLNEFSSEVGNNYVFHKISSDKLNKIILNAERFKENYSTIFIKKGKPVFFNRGPIVEPQVYKFVKLTYSSKSIKPKYLNQFAPEEVTIEFRKCNEN